MPCSETSGICNAMHMRAPTHVVLRNTRHDGSHVSPARGRYMNEHAGKQHDAHSKMLTSARLHVTASRERQRSGEEVDEQ
jgi:hypothetical protein